jgi:hypothetical protein|tara:strand:- start:238 stop:435 length:198 start_codon:yes stop_codon:yes gene_type:complete
MNIKDFHGIHEGALEQRISNFLKYDATMVAEWKSPFSDNEHWTKVENDAKRLTKEILKEIKFQNT